MDYEIVLHNKRIWDFYEKHKNLDIEDMNIILIEILEKLYNTSENTLNASSVRLLLDNIKNLQSQMNSFSDSFSKMQSDLNMNFVMKLTEFKKEYIEDVRMILINNTSEKIVPLFEKYNDILQDKTRIIINDIIPKNQESLKRDIIHYMKALQDNLDKEFEIFSNQKITPELLNNLISSIDDKFSKTIVNTQGILNNIVSSSEHRMTSQIGEIKDLANSTNITNKQLHNNLNEMLKKFENSSIKGKISENLLFNVIQTLYPNAQIDYAGGTKESGDIILTRKDKSVILFENKNYDNNVGKSEIDKFYRDIDVQKCNGILLSQKTAIVNKDNYEIELYNGRIVIFLHNVNYDSDKIKTAVDIIDHFQEILYDINENNDSNNASIEICKYKLEEINTEYNNFINVKMNHIKTIKECSQKMLSQAENFKLPNLENILSKNFSNSLSSKEHICEYCGYKAKNPRALIAHLRGCNENKEKKAALKNTIVYTNNPENETKKEPINVDNPFPIDSQPKITIKPKK